MRHSFARIFLSNLVSNYLTIRKKVHPAGVIAVVKADAYGHGSIPITNALRNSEVQPEMFGVAISEEAVELRKAGIKNPILIFEPLSKYNLKTISDFNLTATITSNDEIELLRISSSKSQKLTVHVKVDTGMGRLGFFPESAIDAVHKLTALRNVTLEGIYTHFATSDEANKDFAYSQLNIFKEIIQLLSDSGYRPKYLHTANSGAIIDIPESYFDLVRPGISLYGYYPSLETSQSIELSPVMEIVSEVSSIKYFRKGESVSYGRLYFLPQDANIVSVPFGYADGLNRNLSNNMCAIINGKIYPQVGRITMDRIMFDLGSDTANLHDEVILIGTRAGKKIDAWEWSEKLNTIPYEITCAISRRVPRIYIK